MSDSQGTGGDLGQSDNYQRLLGQISETYTQGRIQATQAINIQLIETYWEIGRYIVEFEQGGKVKAEYGTVLSNLCDAAAQIELVAYRRVAQN